VTVGDMVEHRNLLFPKQYQFPQFKLNPDPKGGKLQKNTWHNAKKVADKKPTRRSSAHYTDI